MNETLNSILDRVKDIGVDLLIIAVIFILARITINIVSKITGNTMKKADNLTDKEKSQQIKTSMTITHSANRYVIYLVAIVLCLKVIGLGEQVSGALVAAGVGGLVISLGAQSIVKDMLAGLFLMFEKQYYVGDYVKIAGYEGTVTSIALRNTYLNCGGRKVIVPNGDIRDVINYSKANSIATISIPTSYKDDTRKIIGVMQKVIDKYYVDNPDLLTENVAKVAGISSLESDRINVSVFVETKPLKHWQVQRELTLLIKEELAKKKISIAPIQIVEKSSTL